MSTFYKVTRHPLTGTYERAMWQDDYFGPNVYGVVFPSDKITWPEDMVTGKEVKNFWAEDVKAAFIKWYGETGTDDEIQMNLMLFLNYLQAEYKARWERDPVNGEGAVQWLQDLTGPKAVRTSELNNQHEDR